MICLRSNPSVQCQDVHSFRIVTWVMAVLCLEPWVMGPTYLRRIVMHK